MRYTDIAIIGGGLAGSTAAAMLGPRRHSRHPRRSPAPICGQLSAVKTFRPRADRTLSQDRYRGNGAEGRKLPDRELDRALPLSARPQAGPAIRHPLRRAGQCDPGTKCRPARKSCSPKAVVDLDHCNERQKSTVLANQAGRFPRAWWCYASGLKSACAKPARHRAADRQSLPVDLARVQHRPGRAAGLRLSGADLFLGTA